MTIASRKHRVHIPKAIGLYNFPAWEETIEGHLPQSVTIDVSSVSSLIAQIQQPQFPAAMDTFIMEIARFDFSTVFAFTRSSLPLILYNGYRQYAKQSALQAYLNGAYLLDPFYTACADGRPPGLWRMRDLAPDKFFNSEFYRSPEIHPCVSMQAGCLVEEIGFLIRFGSRFSAVYSLMRAQGAAFSEDEFKRLQSVEPIVRELIKVHWRDAGSRIDERRTDDPFELAFRSFQKERLTSQQQRIVELILRGHSNLSIAGTISITEGTVKIHRQNIYKRLNISSQRELFLMFMESLFRPSDADFAAKDLPV